MTLVDTVIPPANVSSAGSSNGILHVLSVIPYVTISTRGLIILSLLLMKRNELSNLCLEIDRFLAICFPTVSYRRTVLKSLARWSTASCIVTIVVHAVYDTLDDITYYGDIDILTDDLDSSTWRSQKAWHSLVIWVLFSNIPFVLSQQAYLYPVLLATLLNRAIKDLKHDLKAATVRVCETTESDIITEMEVKIWRAKQMAMLRFCGLINDCFSLILFFIYWLDFLTLLGYTSSFTKISSGEPITTYLRLVFNCIVFASYGALIPIPLVCAYENVSCSCPSLAYVE
ncbi:hypothetical protein RvY_16667-1 [Ramazzottius varieornatus]|uniref:Uncharacterized protein n=1 Tax=Ramazzottius varieornatus TaxID=947166 RepID=A0A1D1VZB0_RAMVA|nr:hypothetical protein RvY_16667-1 [Ramazzottius varieornatus]